MLKPISRRFEAALMAYKGAPEPKAPVVEKAKSPYKGINSTEFSTDFGSASSSVGKNAAGQKSINTTATLTPDLQAANTTAMSGLNSNLSYLQTDPDQRMAAVVSGQNPLYQTLETQRLKNEEATLGRLQLRAQGTGNLNSTAAGSAYAGVGNESLNRQTANQLAALEYGNQNARADAGLSMGVTTGLAGLMYPMMSGSNAQLNTSMGSQQQVAMANAAAQNQANMANWQAMQSYNQQQQQSQANTLGAITSMGGILPGAIYGGMTGGWGGALAGGAAGGATSLASISAGMGFPGAFGSGGATSTPYSGPTYFSTLPDINETNHLVGDFGGGGGLGSLEMPMVA